MPSKGYSVIIERTVEYGFYIEADDEHEATKQITKEIGDSVIEDGAFETFDSLIGEDLSWDVTSVREADRPTYELTS